MDEGGQMDEVARRDPFSVSYRLWCDRIRSIRADANPSEVCIG